MAKKSENKVDLKKIANGVRLMLEGIGEDPEREGLQKTPERVADFYAELTEGMWIDPDEQIVPLPGDSHDEMVLVKDISIASVCEHHLAPFVGKCHIAYIPKGGRISRTVKTRTNRRDIRTPAAGSGTPHPADSENAFRQAPTRRRDGRDRGRAHVHDTARRQKAGRDNDNIGRSRRIPKRPANAGRGDGFDKGVMRLLQESA